MLSVHPLFLPDWRELGLRLPRSRRLDQSTYRNPSTSLSRSFTNMLRGCAGRLARRLAAADLGDARPGLLVLPRLREDGKPTWDLAAPVGIETRRIRGRRLAATFRNAWASTPAV